MIVIVGVCTGSPVGVGVAVIVTVPSTVEVTGMLVPVGSAVCVLVGSGVAVAVGLDSSAWVGLAVGGMFVG